jgi:Ca-activated chloride channel family protein
MMLSSKTLLGLLAAGWLAEALASTHGDIDAGVAAYNAGDSEAALTSYAAAEADLGERPEIHFNKGLALLAKDDKEGARKAFEHGTESEFSAVHASAEYELGNLELDAEAFDAAIERYTKCLKLKPDHANAKWNLELALLKKKQKEEEEEKKKKEEEKNKDENKDEETEGRREEGRGEEGRGEEGRGEEGRREEGRERRRTRRRRTRRRRRQKPEKKDEEKKDEQKPEDKGEDAAAAAAAAARPGRSRQGARATRRRGQIPAWAPAGPSGAGGEGLVRCLDVAAS